MYQGLSASKCRLFLFLSLLTSASIQADSLLELYQEALQADPRLNAAIFDHTATQELVPQAWAGYRPTVTIEADRINTTQEIKRSDNAVFDQGKTSFPTTTWTLSVSQPIFRYANYKRIGQAKEELKKADAELIQAQQDLILRISEVYLAALSAADELSFLESERTAVGQQLELARGREQAAVGRSVDTYDALARMASVEADYAVAQVVQQDAEEAIYEIIGRDPISLDLLREDISLQSPQPADEEHWVDAAMQQNPALVVQRHVVEVGRTEIARQQAGHYPTVDAVARYNNQDTQGTLFGGGSEVGTQEILLRFSMPLYSGGIVSSRKREAIARHSSALQELTRIMRESRRQSRDAYWGVVTAIKRIDALEQAVSAQQATLELRRVAYESRLQTTISVLDAERDLYAVKRDLTQAKYDYLLNGLRLKSLVGILTLDDLQQINAMLEN
ncbi:MAG: outer membrane protein [Gammaproteobacteria bacterium]|jgi:outer membrane protein